MWLSLASFWTLTHSATGQHLSTGLAFRERSREKPLWPQNALSLAPDRWVWSSALDWFQEICIDFRTGHLYLTVLSHWQMENCTLAHLLISWEGTLLFSVRWEIIIQSGQNSMIQDGWMVKKKKISGRIQFSCLLYDLVSCFIWYWYMSGCCRWSPLKYVVVKVFLMSVCSPSWHWKLLVFRLHKVDKTHFKTLLKMNH